MKTNAPVLLVLGIAVAMILVGASSNLVSAQIASPCTATLSYPIMSPVYGYSSVPAVVPISATCETSYVSQLYATGSAYDTTSNTALGSVSTVLTSANGGTQFNGQLGFNLPSTAQGDSIQISVSLYNGQYGNLITTTGETVQVGTAVQQTATTTVTETEDPYTSPYSAYSPQPNQLDPSTQFHQTHFQSQALTRANSNTSLFDYIVIIAILASVIIATTGLVLVARRQPAWPQPQYSLPQ